MLNVHYAVGLLLLVTALAAIASAPARRIVVYVLALQVVLGVATWWSTKLVAPPAHWILALLVGGVWPMSNALERRGRPAAAVLAVRILGAVVVAYVIYLGMHTLHARTPSA